MLQRLRESRELTPDELVIEPASRWKLRHTTVGSVVRSHLRVHHESYILLHVPGSWSITHRGGRTLDVWATMYSYEQYVARAARRSTAAKADWRAAEPM